MSEAKTTIVFASFPEAPSVSRIASTPSSTAICDSSWLWRNASSTSSASAVIGGRFRTQAGLSVTSGSPNAGGRQGAIPSSAPR